jgi:uncharacterized protein involved in exopolysaccharide biosynthesis
MTMKTKHKNRERRGSDKVKAGAQLSSVIRRMPSPVWRALAVVCLAALAGLAAFVVMSGEPKTYQRESSFAIRPSERVPSAALSDVVGTLSQPDSAVTETVVDMLGSARLRSTAATAAGLPPASVAESGGKYGWKATRRPGSTVVDVTLTGPSDAKLLDMQTGLSAEAARLVEGNFALYRLESLSAPTSSPDQVGPKTKQTVALALILGGLLGVALVLFERKLRSSLGTATLDRGSEGPPRGNDDLTGETDGIPVAISGTRRQRGGATARRER